MILSRRTGVGCKLAATAGAGSQPWPLWIYPGARIAIVDAGFTATAGGIGCRITPGDGLRSIMDDGTITLTRVGFGRPEQLGARPGSVGDTTAVIAAGRRCRPKPTTSPVSDFGITGRTSALASISAWAIMITRS
jgi:hypothetical protein